VSEYRVRFKQNQYTLSLLGFPDNKMVVEETALDNIMSGHPITTRVETTQTSTHVGGIVNGDLNEGVKNV